MFDFDLNDIEEAKQQVEIDKQKEIDIQKKWALVCQGGGFKGAWEAGFLTTLNTSKNIEFITHIGTSIGAINCALKIASIQDKNIMKKIWGEVTWWKTISLFRNQKNLRKVFLGKISKKNISEVINKHNLFLNIITTRKKDGTMIEFPFLFRSENIKSLTSKDDHNKIIKSLIASASIPFVFPPVSIKDKHSVLYSYVDGGLVNNNPLKHAQNLGLRNILILSPTNSLIRNNSFLKKVVHYFSIFAAKLPCISWLIFIDTQMIRAIASMQDLLYSKEQRFRLLSQYKEVNEKIIKKSIPQAYICFPSKHLKTGNYIFTTRNKVKRDFIVGMKDGKNFLRKLKDDDISSYALEKVDLSVPIKTNIDKKIGETIFFMHD